MFASLTKTKHKLTIKETASIQSYLNKGYRFFLYSFGEIEHNIKGEFYLVYGGKITKNQNKYVFKKRLKVKHPDYKWVDLSKDCDGNNISASILDNIFKKKQIWIIF